MTNNIQFTFGTEADDSELRAVIRRIPMEGSISLTFGREPSFLAAAKTGSLKSETIVGRKAPSSSIIGFGERSLRKVYMNGEEKTIWYLHTLRILPKERNARALLRGYQYFHSLPNESSAPYFLTTILDDNITAKKILESGRAGMPSYTRVGTLQTYLIPLRTRKKIRTTSPEIGRASHLSISSAYSCLDSYNKGYSLAPRYDIPDLLGVSGILPAFNPENLYTFSFEGKVAGTLGVWDQQSFKQSIVASYSPRMKILRSVYNAQSYFSGSPYLPKTGNQIRMIYACLLSVMGNDTAIFGELLDQVINDWSGIGHDWLVVGLLSGSPLERVVHKKSARQISSGVYLVHWKEDELVFPDRFGKIHLEVATL